MRTLSSLKSSPDHLTQVTGPNLKSCLTLLSKGMSEVTAGCLGMYHGPQESTVAFPLHVLYDFKRVQTFVILLVPCNNHEAYKTMIFTPIYTWGNSDAEAYSLLPKAGGKLVAKPAILNRRQMTVPQGCNESQLAWEDHFLKHPWALVLGQESDPGSKEIKSY